MYDATILTLANSTYAPTSAGPREGEQEVELLLNCRVVLGVTRHLVR